MPTTQPFTFLVLGLEETPELAALAAQGHRIIYAGCITAGNSPQALIPIDKVIGPNCWRLLPDQMRWLPLALKEMRALQPKPKKGKKSGAIAS